MPPMPRRTATWPCLAQRDADAEVRASWCAARAPIFPPAATIALIESMIADEATLLRVWKEASELVYNMVNCSKPVVSAIRGRPWGRPGDRAAGGRVHRGRGCEDPRRPHSTRGGRR